MTGRWHFGRKISGGQRSWWLNVWLEHPCADLALPFEVGGRVMAEVVKHGD